MLLALIVFAVTYVLISARQLGALPIARPEPWSARSLAWRSG